MALLGQTGSGAGLSQPLGSRADAVCRVRAAWYFSEAFKRISLREAHLRRGPEANWRTANLLNPEWRGSRRRRVFLLNLKPKQPFVKEQTNKQLLNINLPGNSVNRGSGQSVLQQMPT